jgi:hypothetical protein
MSVGRNGSKDGPKGNLGGEACRIDLWKGASIYILAVACHAHANRMPLAWQSHDHSWMIEDVILNTPPTD